MKRILALVIAMSMVLSLAACGGSDNDVPSDSEETLQNDAANDDIKVEKELFDVVVTLPASMVGETTQEDLDAEASEHFHSATLNEDGSVSITMSKKQHKQVMTEFAQSIDESLAEMVGSEEYPNITDIKANKDYTHFDVTTKNTELSFEESFVVIGFYMFGGMYAAFNGTLDDAEITVDFINASSGEIIDSVSSADMTD